MKRVQECWRCLLLDHGQEFSAVSGDASGLNALSMRIGFTYDNVLARRGCKTRAVLV